MRGVITASDGETERRPAEPHTQWLVELMLEISLERSATVFAR